MRIVHWQSEFTKQVLEEMLLRRLRASSTNSMSWLLSLHPLWSFWAVSLLCLYDRNEETKAKSHQWLTSQQDFSLRGNRLKFLIIQIYITRKSLVNSRMPSCNYPDVFINIALKKPSRCWFVEIESWIRELTKLSHVGWSILE